MAIEHSPQVAFEKANKDLKTQWNGFVSSETIGHWEPRKAIEQAQFGNVKR